MDIITLIKNVLTAVNDLNIAADIDITVGGDNIVHIGIKLHVDTKGD